MIVFITTGYGKNVIGGADLWCNNFIENVLPDLVYQRKGYQFDDFKHLEYNSFHAIAIKAIQELTEKVEKLEAKISGSI